MVRLGCVSGLRLIPATTYPIHSWAYGDRRRRKRRGSARRSQGELGGPPRESAPNSNGDVIWDIRIRIPGLAFWYPSYSQTGVDTQTRFDGLSAITERDEAFLSLRYTF
jgi:hypothetical protein